MSQSKDQIECNSLESVNGQWDTWVKSSPQGTPFGLSAFLMVYCKVLKLRVDIWTIERNGNWIAALPILYYTRFGAKTNHGIPLMPYLPIMFAPNLFNSTYPSSNTALYLKLTQLLNDILVTRYSSISLSLLPGTMDVRPWIWDRWKLQTNYTYILDLKDQPRFTHAVRKQVRKAEESGVLLDKCWDINMHCELLDSTRRRQGIWIGLDQEPFKEIATYLYNNGLATMATARTSEGLPLASRIELIAPESGIAYDWTAGTNSEWLALGGSSWLIVQIYNYFIKTNIIKWNLCGASYETVARFKAEFGGELHLQFYVQSPRKPISIIYEEGRNIGSKIIRGCGWKR